MMPRWKTLWLIATREWRSRRKAFAISTSILVTVVSGGLVAIGLASGGPDGPVTYRVGTVGPSVAVEALINTYAPPGFIAEVTVFSSVEEIERRMEDGELEFGIASESEVLSYPGRSKAMLQAISAALSDRQVRKHAEELGVSPADLNAMLDTEVTVREVVEPSESFSADSALAAASLFFTFMGILAYGQWVAFGVVEEKAGRVVEVVLSAVTPRQLLTAKIISIGLLGLSQLLIVGFLVLLLGGLIGIVDLPDATGGAFVIIIGWFLLGYAFYAAGYAASGALVRSAQDSSDAVGGFNLLLMIGYFTAVSSLIAERDNLAVQIASFVPITAPLTMPMRMVRGDVAWWEGGLAVGIMLIATYGMVRLGALVFRRGIIRVGKKLKWREILRRQGT
ncbi:MAG: ABC transporter permease [Acidimicrobiia bacterium]